MMRIYTFCFLIVINLFANLLDAKADVGQTYDLKIKRENLLRSGQDSLGIKLEKLDNELIVSYEETIRRIEENEKALENNQSKLVLLGLSGLFFSMLLLFTVWILNERLNTLSGKSQKLTYTLREVLVSLLYQGLPSKDSLAHSRGVHFIIFVCMIGMLVSMVGYLVKLI